MTAKVKRKEKFGHLKQRYKDRDGLTASRAVIFMGDFTQKLFRL